ncbi:hypothetical protein [Oceaniovalibus sp. ACAM 378]|uniref:hypothetical protein n=1 Tax=Oceaniovalibus sp. ACAM 378 TaxID=2599923 RepID=UPI0016523138|nr:hypothetical protein [Oceaniovalibus sp. ACAM 378]
MHDLFKRARANTQRKLRRAGVLALTEMWGKILGAPKPKKRKVKNPGKPVNKACIAF